MISLNRVVKSTSIATAMKHYMCSGKSAHTTSRRFEVLPRLASAGLSYCLLTLVNARQVANLGGVQRPCWESFSSDALNRGARVGEATGIAYQVAARQADEFSGYRHPSARTSGAGQLPKLGLVPVVTRDWVLFDRLPHEQMRPT